MRTTRIVKAMCVVGAAAAVATTAPATAAADPVEFGGDVRFVGNTVVSTVHVPVVPDPTFADYVARVFMFDVYGICRNKAGKVQLDSEQRVGGGRFPYGSGNYVLRIPPSEQTTFTFTDSVEVLLRPPPTGQLAPVVCPKGQTPGLHRINIDEYQVYATSFGRRDIPVDVDYYLPAPVKPSKRKVT